MSRSFKNRLRLVGFLLVAAGAPPLAAEDVASPDAQSPPMSAECRSLQELADTGKKLIAQLKAIGGNGAPARCPIYRQAVGVNDAMIAIFDRDPERCGAQEDVVERLRKETQKAHKTIARVCPKI